MNQASWVPTVSDSFALRVLSCGAAYARLFSDCSEDLLSRAKRGSVGLITHFKQVTDTHAAAKAPAPPLEFVLATAHLFWDPAQEDVKLLQTRRVLRPLHAFSQSLGLPTIFAGDFNSLPNSQVYNLITKEHHFESAYARYNSNIATQDAAAVGEPDFTNVNGARDDDSANEGSQVPSFVGTLDYVFYQPARCVNMWTAMHSSCAYF